MSVTTIANLWKQYLVMTSQDEKLMHPAQLRETRRAYYGACGQLLILFRDSIGRIADENAAVEAAKKIELEVATFWLGEGTPK